MAIRGRLAVNDAGELVMIDPNASDPSNPTSEEILPVSIDEVDLNNLIDGSNTSHTGEIADISDVISTGDVTSANWGDYEIQKNGTDGQGIINFKTA